MNLSSTYLPHDVLLFGDAQPIIGTAVLGEAFGKIKSLKIKRDGEGVELMNGSGSLRGHVTLKPGISGTMEVYFDSTVNVPPIYTIISIPYDNLTIAARTMAGAEITHDDGKERGLSIPVQMWDALLGQAAYRLDTLTGNRYLLDIGIPVPAAVGGSGAITTTWAAITGATSYVIQSSSDSGVTWTAAGTPSTGTFTATVTTGQTRYYRVAAVSADGTGEWSQSTHATAA